MKKKVFIFKYRAWDDYNAWMRDNNTGITVNDTNMDKQTAARGICNHWRGR